MFTAYFSSCNNMLELTPISMKNRSDHTLIKQITRRDGKEMPKKTKHVEQACVITQNTHI